jgi:MFS superfamily sulfate permease-like transporter
MRPETVAQLLRKGRASQDIFWNGHEELFDLLFDSPLFTQSSKLMKSNFAYLKTDIVSGIVVFLVAVPLCLGIALASGAPLFSGIIAGIIGGIVVGILSNSHISVSGPAAGLAAIVLVSIATLGSFEAFLLATLLAGLMQLALGFAKAGTIANYIPSNVIDGMLTGIGIIIFLKQLPTFSSLKKEQDTILFLP